MLMFILDALLIEIYCQIFEEGLCLLLLYDLGILIYIYIYTHDTENGVLYMGILFLLLILY